MKKNRYILSLVLFVPALILTFITIVYGDINVISDFILNVYATMTGTLTCVDQSLGGCSPNKVTTTIISCATLLFFYLIPIIIIFVSKKKNR